MEKVGKVCLELQRGQVVKNKKRKNNTGKYKSTVGQLMRMCNNRRVSCRVITVYRVRIVDEISGIKVFIKMVIV